MMVRNMDPVTHPTVNIGGKDYPLKFRQKDIVGLKMNHAIDITERVGGIDAIARLPTIVAAGLAHLGTVTATEVADYMENLDIGEFSIYALAVMEAQKKASPSALKASETIAGIVEMLKLKTTDTTQ